MNNLIQVNNLKHTLPFGTLKLIFEDNALELREDYRREATGENLCLQRKELEQEQDVLWQLIAAMMRSSQAGEKGV